MEKNRCTRGIFQYPIQDQTLPNSIFLYASNSSLKASEKQQSFYALIDLKDHNLGLKSVFGIDNQKHTPLEFAQMEKEPVYIVLNGGYFNVQTGESQSLIIHDSKMVHEINTAQGKYHPTIGSFGVYEDNSLEIAWAYTPDKTTVFAYNQPAMNSQDKPPLPQPNSTWPQGAKPWKVQEALSSGPLLLKNGVQYTGHEEMISASLIDDKNPRSAVCHTYDNKMILFVADGRSAVADGFTLTEMTYVLKQLNCRDILNLDGGGSSCMVVNDQIINKPSDPVPRPVANAFMVFKK